MACGDSCLNDGTCVNGDCDCAVGFSGPDCSDQITPTKISIEKIELTRFPAVEQNGAGWDLTSGPDIFVTMSYNNVDIYNHPSTYENANASETYVFTPSINLNIENPDDKYVISLYDFDSFDPDDFMGGIEFVPYNDENEFPEELFLDADGHVAFTLTETYSF